MWCNTFLTHTLSYTNPCIYIALDFHMLPSIWLLKPYISTVDLPQNIISSYFCSDHRNIAAVCMYLICAQQSSSLQDIVCQMAVCLFSFPLLPSIWLNNKHHPPNTITNTTTTDSSTFSLTSNLAHHVITLPSVSLIWDLLNYLCLWPFWPPVLCWT